MALSISRRTCIWVAAVGFVALLMMLALPSPGSALPAYTTATGQSCSTCHVNPAGGGPLTAAGQAFAAIPTHSTDPAGAYLQLVGAAAPPAQPTTPPTVAAATPVPAPSTPAVLGAAPSALPSAGEGSPSTELSMALALLGLVALGAGLTFARTGARDR